MILLYYYYYSCVIVCVQVVAGVSHSVVYGLMCFVLDQFHADSLGSDSQVTPSECLAVAVVAATAEQKIECRFRAYYNCDSASIRLQRSDQNCVERNICCICAANI